MAWKQDLAKLKQQLGPEVPVTPSKLRPKPTPKPEGPAALEDEDDIFLSAMGRKPAAARPIRPEVTEVPAAPAPPAAPAVSETFEAAVKDLKGFKPLGKRLPEPRPPLVSAPTVPKDAPKPTPVPPPPPEEDRAVAPSSSAPPSPSAPLRFQLAAGMAIEVDGTLDLRGHSLSDAMERLKDRLADGAVLGWRSLQVTLGTDPVLHEGLMVLLASGQAPAVGRYAQAPVPMGGTQAWLLYFGPTPGQS